MNGDTQTPQESADSIMAQSEFDLPAPQVLALINQNNCSACHCEFVDLAHHLNIPLVTQDKEVLRTTKNIGKT